MPVESKKDKKKQNISGHLQQIVSAEGLKEFTLELEKPQREVDYFGLNLIVPHDTAFLSTDADGEVTAHSDEPWMEPGFYEGHELGVVAKIKLPYELFWDDSLIKYEAEH